MIRHAADERPQPLAIGNSLPAQWTSRDVIRDRRRLGRSQLLVDTHRSRAQLRGSSFEASPAIAGFRMASSRSRARDSRDMTVPIGTPATAAMSSDERPSSSRRTMTSRKSTGNDSTALWTCSTVSRCSSNPSGPRLSSRRSSIASS
jgi:hypothetical protein